jgi:hypothetical protein
MHQIEEWVRYQEHLATDHIQDNTINHIRMISVNELNKLLNNDIKKILVDHHYKQTIWITLELFNNLKNEPKIKIIENPNTIYYGTILEEIIRFNVTCLATI